MIAALFTVGLAAGSTIQASNRRQKAYVNLDTIRDVNSHPRARRETVEQCVLRACAGDALACLGDGDCAVKINCALSCTTADCANGCAGDSPSSATTALLSCAIANSCISSKFDSDVVVAAIASYKAKQTPAECAQASCPGDALGCLLDADCSSKVGCALNCETVDCINACAQPSPSSVTSSLIACAISSGCVSSKRDSANAAPAGTYHGVKNILGVKIDGTIKVDDATHFDLDITDAATIHCANEVWSYDGSKKITVPGADKSGDCVHDNLEKNHLMLKGVEYDSGKDTITVKVAVKLIADSPLIDVSITLNHEGTTDMDYSFGESFSQVVNTVKQSLAIYLNAE